MTNFKFFNLMKNDKQGNDKAPDYRISAKDDTDFVEIGAAWLKKDKNGQNFLSCKLNDPYKDKKGYHITDDEQKAPEDPSI